MKQNKNQYPKNEHFEKFSEISKKAGYIATNRYNVIIKFMNRNSIKTFRKFLISSKKDIMISCTSAEIALKCEENSDNNKSASCLFLSKDYIVIDKPENVRMNGNFPVTVESLTHQYMIK
jgi:hypothetical protein